MCIYIHMAALAVTEMCKMCACSLQLLTEGPDWNPAIHHWILVYYYSNSVNFRMKRLLYYIQSIHSRQNKPCPLFSTFNILFILEVCHNTEVKTVVNFRFTRTLNIQLYQFWPAGCQTARFKKPLYISIGIIYINLQIYFPPWLVLRDAVFIWFTCNSVYLQYILIIIDKHGINASKQNKL